MDFANLDLRAASERGSWVHLTYLGKPLYLDEDADEPEKPQRIKVRGMGSKAVIEAFRHTERVETLRAQRMSRTKEVEAEGVISKFQADLEAAMADLIVAAVADWENIVWDGKPMEMNKENVLKLCGPTTMFFAQVNKAIAEEHRLFTDADSA